MSNCQRSQLSLHCALDCALSLLLRASPASLHTCREELVDFIIDEGLWQRAWMQVGGSVHLASTALPRSRSSNDGVHSTATVTSTALPRWRPQHCHGHIHSTATVTSTALPWWRPQHCHNRAHQTRPMSTWPLNAACGHLFCTAHCCCDDAFVLH